MCSAGGSTETQGTTGNPCSQRKQRGAEWKQLDEPEATVEGLLSGYGSFE